MKKSAMAVCGAVFAAVAFAQEPAPAPEGATPASRAGGAPLPKPDRPQRGNRVRQSQPPMTFVIDEKTTAEQIDAFKKELAAKVDAAFEAYKAKPAPENGEAKPHTRIMLMVTDRSFGGPRMGKGPGAGRGGNGERPQGMRGLRGPKPEAPAPADDAK